MPITDQVFALLAAISSCRRKFGPPAERKSRHQEALSENVDQVVDPHEKYIPRVKSLLIVCNSPSAIGRAANYKLRDTNTMNNVRALQGHLQRASIAAIGLIGLSISAHAQESSKDQKDQQPGEQLQEVVVTGSRIARSDLDRLEPTIVLDSATFDRRGYLDVGQALSENPAFGVQPSSNGNVQSPFGMAQSFVDLYGLGSQRTLTLVDGLRFVSSNTASLNTSGSNNPNGGPGDQVDLNVIPTKLIDNIE